MQVFKVYFKIILKNIPMLMIYIVVFVGVTIGFSASGQSQKIAQFTETRSSVALINGDAGGVLTDGLAAYIAGRSNPVEIADDSETLQEALFFRKVECVIRIPEGFSQDFLDGKETTVEMTSVPDSASGVYVEMMIQSYLDSARQYVRYLPGLSQRELAQKVADDLSLEADVVLRDNGKGGPGTGGLNHHFNFASYPMLIILILGITTCMMAFNNTLQKRRTLCSPVGQNRISLELLLGNLVFTAVIWAVIMAVLLVLCGTRLFSVGGLLFAVNLFMISIVGLCISFLVGNLIKSKNVQSGVANTIVLSMSFLSGSFVPQELLGTSVLAVGRFLPAYWYVLANDRIAALGSFGFEELKPILISYLIQLGFAAALVSVALVISRQRRISAAN